MNSTSKFLDVQFKSEGSIDTPHLPFTKLLPTNSCHCLILWFRKTSALAAAHIAATDDARSDGGQTEGWRADGEIETEPHRTRPASRGEADFPLSSYRWGFSGLKLPLYFHVSTCSSVLSECPSFLDASWQNLVNSVISLIQKSSGTMKTILQGGFDQLLAMWLPLVSSLLQIFLIRGTLLHPFFFFKSYIWIKSQFTMKNKNIIYKICPYTRLHGCELAGMVDIWWNLWSKVIFLKL